MTANSKHHFLKPGIHESAVDGSDALDLVIELLANDLEAVEAEIEKRLQSQVPTVTQIARHIVASGGKRIRPMLCLLVAKSLGYEQTRSAIMAAAIEFVHTATLLHDDVIDNSQLRRGRPSCNAIWDNKMSVLVGDFLYCQVSSMITEDGDLNILKCITDATTNTTEGEVLEVTKSRDLQLDETEYFKIIEFKTAKLMSCATQTGAILAKVGNPLETKMRDFGMHLGMAFQLADDVLDYTSAVSEFGKETGIDLKEGKVTYPLLHALKRCDTEEREIIREGTINASPKIFQQVLDILKKYQAIEATLSLAQEQLEICKGLLAFLPENQYTQALGKLTEYVNLRQK